MARLAFTLAAAASVAGCFQPLYGDRPAGTAGGPNIAQALSGVDIQQITAANGTPEARIAVQLRNDLIFATTGGSGGASPTHRLQIRMSSSRTSIIVDTQTGRPDVEDFGLTITYELVDLSTGKAVVKDTTFSRVSYDIPGQQQRFARDRALRESEDRAAQVVADNIKARLASFFVAGT